MVGEKSWAVNREGEEGGALPIPPASYILEEKVAAEQRNLSSS